MRAGPLKLKNNIQINPNNVTSVLGSHGEQTGNRPSSCLLHIEQVTTACFLCIHDLLCCSSTNHGGLHAYITAHLSAETILHLLHPPRRPGQDEADRRHHAGPIGASRSRGLLETFPAGIAQTTAPQGQASYRWNIPSTPLPRWNGKWDRGQLTSTSMAYTLTHLYLYVMPGQRRFLYKRPRIGS